MSKFKQQSRLFMFCLFFFFLNASYADGVWVFLPCILPPPDVLRRHLLRDRRRGLLLRRRAVVRRTAMQASQRGYSKPCCIRPPMPSTLVVVPRKGSVDALSGAPAATAVVAVVPALCCSHPMETLAVPRSWRARRESLSKEETRSLSPLPPRTSPPPSPPTSSLSATGRRGSSGVPTNIVSLMTPYHQTLPLSLRGGVIAPIAAGGRDGHHLPKT